MNWSNLWSKVKHALAPAAGAAAGAVGDAIVNGNVSPRTVVMGAVGAFFAYLFKPARPAPTLDSSAVK